MAFHAITKILYCKNQIKVYYMLEALPTVTDLIVGLIQVEHRQKQTLNKSPKSY